MAPPLVSTSPVSVPMIDAAGAMPQRKGAAAAAELRQEALVKRGNVHVESVFLDAAATA